MKKGIFDRVEEFGGKRTIVFDQSRHQFISLQQKRLKAAGKYEQIELIDKGVCAAISLNWLKYQANLPKKIYPIETILNDEKQAARIVSHQCAFRKAGISLAETLPLFGLKEKPELHQESQFQALMFGLGNKVISYQAGEFSHVAVAKVIKNDEGIIFRLFDAARGEVEFTIKDEKTALTAYDWVENYLAISCESYRKVYPETGLCLTEFDNGWKPDAAESVNLYLHSLSEKCTQKKPIPTPSDKTQTMIYGSTSRTKAETPTTTPVSSFSQS